MRLFNNLIILVFLLGISLEGSAQSEVNYYVVIGAFAKRDNATRFVAFARKNNYEAKSEMNPVRGLNYVYIKSTQDKKDAFKLLIKVRIESDYKDAWVFIGKLGDVKEEKVVEVEKKESVKEEVKEPAKEAMKKEPVIEEIKTEELPKKDTVKNIVKSDTVKVKKAEPIVKKPAGKPFYFKLINKESGNVVLGEVHIQETSASTSYQSYKANEIIYLLTPRNKTGTYLVNTQAAGYQPITVNLDYANPTGTKGASDEEIIEVALPKAKRGDYIDFSNVSFFKNSVVLQPPSQNELDGLVDVMKENPKYKIRVHGHCNGTQDRNVSLMGKSSIFFALSRDNKIETMGDKEFSLLKAENVKAYLVSKGVEGHRISVKGEGGKIPIYDRNGTLGVYNDRIEVEIIKH